METTKSDDGSKFYVELAHSSYMFILVVGRLAQKGSRKTFCIK